MKIQSIELEGLWSYSDPQAIDISGLPLIVGMGENGAGKSTLMVSAILVAFYGKFPTKTIEESITTGASQGRVSVEFTLAGVRYRVGRVYPRSGTASGVVMVQDAEQPSGWRTVTEKGIREVTAYMTTLLGMDYETATMTWVAEQGNYGKFSAAQPSERFRLLSTVFGLDEYAAKAKLASDHLKKDEALVTALEGRIIELNETMVFADESDDADSLSAIADDKLAALHAEAEKAVDATATELAELNAADPMRKTVEARQALEIVRNARVTALEHAQQTNARATTAIETARNRAETTRVAAQARHDSDVAAAEARTAQARTAAEAARAAAATAIAQIDAAVRERPTLVATAEGYRATAETQRVAAETATAAIAEHNARRQVLGSEWVSLKAIVADCESRIASLTRTAEDAAHASCFTCNQHLTAADAAALIQSQQDAIATAEARKIEVKAEADAKATAIAVAEAERATDLAAASVSDESARRAEADIARTDALIATRADRELAGDEADIVVSRAIADEQSIAAAAATTLAETLATATAEELSAVGANDAERIASAKTIAESETPSAEEQRLAAALATAEELVAEGAAVVAEQRSALEARRETERLNARRYDRELVRRVDAAALRVEQMERLKSLEETKAKAEHTRLIHETLVKAYSPTGIPAMILASIVVELNESVNVALERLSRGEMRVELRTQRETSTGTMENKVTVFVETSSGLRAYETLSGGQKFRVDLAIRTGLARSIARGTGTPIETFILDEGWGTLDEKGILATFDTLFRLSEDTNVITVSHIPSVRETFPARVEVTRNGGGSVAEVIR